MTSALEIQNLSIVYKNSNFKIDNLNLTIPQGAIMGLVGKNGAGKSTLINSIFDIVKIDSGKFLFYGSPLNENTKELKNKIGVVFDTLSFSELITAQKLNKVFKDSFELWDSNAYESYLQKFNLPPNKKLKTFSRGMTMKLSIAVALSHGAKLLILDEATAGLDPVIREEILDIFLDFVSNGENSVLMSSHITSDLERIADYITIIDHGNIILSENKDTLLYHYGIARMKHQDFEKLPKESYIAHRNRGFQTEALVTNKEQMNRTYPNMIVDNTGLDDILRLITKGDCEDERIN